MGQIRISSEIVEMVLKKPLPESCPLDARNRNLLSIKKFGCGGCSNKATCKVRGGSNGSYKKNQ